jgi:glycosyltransferase involved in cell wall biosynthesis
VLASKAKRVLFISPTIPFPLTEGGRIRTYSLLKSLSREFEVVFMALQSSPRLMSMAELDAIRLTMTEASDALPQQAIKKTDPAAQPISWILRLPRLSYANYKSRKILRQIIFNSRFDTIFLDYTKMAQYLGALNGTTARKILNVHNAESDTARQMMSSQSPGPAKGVYWLQWKLFEAYEKRFVPRCDLLLAPSQADADFYRRLAPDIKTIVIPNAVDTDALTPLGAREEPFSLIYPGRMDYAPNAEAVEIFCRQIMPRIARATSAVHFYIVGKNPPLVVQRLESEQITVTGFVEEVLPYWKKASALVVPLSIGSGTRIKILEAMALGRPVISTSKGCEGLEVIHEKHLLIADDPERFAEHVIRVLKNPEEYFEMSRAARKLVEEKYSFAAIGNLLLRTLEDTLSEP